MGAYSIDHSYNENLVKETVARNSLLCIVLLKHEVHHGKENEVAGHTVSTLKKQTQVTTTTLILLSFIHSET